APCGPPAATAGTRPTTAGSSTTGPATAPPTGGAPARPTSRNTSSRRSSAVLHADGLDHRLHRRLDHLGVGIAHHHVAVALVAVGARRARLGQARLDDQAADALVGLLD